MRILIYTGCMERLYKNLKNTVIVLILALQLTSCGRFSNDAPATKKYKSVTLETKELAASFDRGKLSFEEHCLSCHISPYNKSGKDGNRLDNVFDMLPAPPENYFAKYIQDSRALKQSGDPFALALDAENNVDYEHHFKDALSQQDIQDLIVFIQIRAKQ